MYDTRKSRCRLPTTVAIIECADAAHGLGGRIIGDGGCTCPGDVAKAFGGGADFVMLGGMLAGHEEAGGELIVKDGETFMKFYGMSSKSAMDKHSGGVAGYRAAEGKPYYCHTVAAYTAPFKTSSAVCAQPVPT